MLSTLYQVHPDFVLREIGDEAVLVPVGDANNFENCIISLNDTYCFIWKQFQKPNTIEAVTARALEEYEAPEGLIERQVREAVEELIKRAVLVEQNEVYPGQAGIEN